jgi:Parvulin-like peptidyl-prolyl isomerase
MKKILMLLVLVVMVTTVEAKGKKEPVVMTVSGKEILLSEFIFIAKKDNSIDFNDKKSVDDYVELFKNYKLKVADAEAMSINQAPKFEQELERFKRQLQESFLSDISDKSGEKEAMLVIYERTKVLPRFTQILFRFDEKNEFVTADTLALYKNAMEAYNRIKNGETFESVAESLTIDGNKEVIYTPTSYIFPLQTVKVLEDKIHSMEPGEMSMPLRSMGGFHIIKLVDKVNNPGRLQVANIFIKFPSSEPSAEEIEATRKTADSIYIKIAAGEDFAELANKHSNDTVSAKRGGILPAFGIGDKDKLIEDAAFALKEKGDISKPVQTYEGFNIMKLIDKKEVISFEELEGSIYEAMKTTERSFDLYNIFDQKMKERHGYVFYPEAYAELERMADEYFPTDSNFWKPAFKMEKPLFRLDTLEVYQNFFVEYMVNMMISKKTYSKDYMQEHFDWYVRDIIREIERDILEKNNSEYNMLINEYYDGIMLFELSNKRVWSHPAEEQEELESEWIKEINEKYPVTINKKVLKNIKKYIK